MEINDDFKARMNDLIKDIPLQLEQAKKHLEGLKPKSSRKVLIDGMEAVASITDANLVVFDFVDKANAQKYLNSLQLI